jgi:hypothetical protein
MAQILLPKRSRRCVSEAWWLHEQWMIALLPMSCVMLV